MSACRMLAVVVGTTLVLGGAAAEDPKLTIAKAEQEIIDLTNQARAKEKLPPLRPHPRLFKSAKAHAANMARQKKLAHVLDGKKPEERIDAAGYDWLECGENCGAYEKLDPKRIVAGWLKSPEHRAEIMNKTFDEIGIGIAKAGNGDYYYVQNFGKLRKKLKK